MSALRVGCVTLSLIPLSDCGVPRVTVAVPDCDPRMQDDLLSAATMVVSGFKSHSAPGNCDVPVTTKSVAV